MCKSSTGTMSEGYSMEDMLDFIKSRKNSYSLIELEPPAP